MARQSISRGHSVRVGQKSSATSGYLSLTPGLSRVCGWVVRFCAILAGLFAAHCAGSDAMYDPPGGKGFWARKSDISSGDFTFYRVTSVFAASSNNANVYVEAKKDVPQSSIDGLLAAFENNIVPIEHVWYTTPTDVDSNGKVNLLLLDIQDGYQPGGGYIAGYFDPINHYSEASVNAANSKYHSNQSEMLYLDTYPADVTKTSFLATLAHEYQHLLQFGRYYKGIQSDIEPAWVDEGLAEVTSDLTGFGPQIGRANNFRTALLNSTPLVAKDSAPFLLDNYATSYIYFRYLADAYGIGGISSIFNDDLIGVGGVDRAIQRIDPQLTSACTNVAGLNYPFFGCSYRFMWAAMIKGNPGDSPIGAAIHFNTEIGPFPTLTASANYTYKLTTLDSTYIQELTNSIQKGSYGPVTTSTATGALQSYSPKLYKINPGGNATNFSPCTNCGLTMVVGTSYYVVYNHDVSTSGTHAASVNDSIAAELTTTAQPDLAPVSPPVEGQSEADQLANAKLHWHFRLHPEMRDFLQP